MASLKQQLNQLIKLRGEISFSELEWMCKNKKFGKVYKLSNAERRLRQSESPDVEPIIIDGAIRKYIWKGRPQEYKTMYVRDFQGNIEKTIKIPI